MKDTLENWILSVANGEEIEAIVIGEMGWGRDYTSEKVPGYNNHPRDKVLKWSEAVEYLKYEFDCGFGAPGCEAIYAWTKSWVIFISQYDGATGVCSIPRNPCDCKPEMPGG